MINLDDIESETEGHMIDPIPWGPSNLEAVMGIQQHMERLVRATGVHAYAKGQPCHRAVVDGQGNN